MAGAGATRALEIGCINAYIECSHVLNIVQIISGSLSANTIVIPINAQQVTTLYIDRVYRAPFASLSNVYRAENPLHCENTEWQHSPGNICYWPRKIESTIADDIS